MKKYFCNYIIVILSLLFIFTGCIQNNSINERKTVQSFITELDINGILLNSDELSKAVSEDGLEFLEEGGRVLTLHFRVSSSTEKVLLRHNSDPLKRIALTDYKGAINITLYSGKNTVSIILVSKDNVRTNYLINVNYNSENENFGLFKKFSINDKSFLPVSKTNRDFNYNAGINDNVKLYVQSETLDDVIKVELNNFLVRSDNIDKTEFSLNLKTGNNNAVVTLMDFQNNIKLIVNINILKLTEEEYSANVGVYDFYFDKKSFLSKLGNDDSDCIVDIGEIGNDNPELILKTVNPYTSVKLKKDDKILIPETFGNLKCNVPLQLGNNIFDLILTSKNNLKTRNIKVIVKRIKEISTEINTIINVISFVGGANVEGSSVNVYEHNDRLNLIASAITDVNGNAEFALSPYNNYDFIAAGKPSVRAESVVENFRVEPDKMNKLVIIQRPHSVGFKAKAPRIDEIKYATATSESDLNISSATVEDGFVFKNLNINSGIFVKFICPASDLGNYGDDGNFGAAMAIGGFLPTL